IKDARLALGGVAHKPWRDPEAEAALRSQPADSNAFAKAAEILLRGAKGFAHNTFKIDLARRAIVRTLAQAAMSTGRRWRVPTRPTKTSVSPAVLPFARFTTTRSSSTTSRSRWCSPRSGRLLGSRPLWFTLTTRQKHTLPICTHKLIRPTLSTN